MRAATPLLGRSGEGDNAMSLRGVLGRVRAGVLGLAVVATALLAVLSNSGGGMGAPTELVPAEGCDPNSEFHHDCLQEQVADLFSSPLLDKEASQYMPPISRGEKWGWKGVPFYARPEKAGLLSPSRDATEREMENLISPMASESPVNDMNVIEAAANQAYRDPFEHYIDPVHEVQSETNDDAYDPLADPLYRYYDEVTRAGSRTNVERTIDFLEKPLDEEAKEEEETPAPEEPPAEEPPAEEPPAEEPPAEEPSPPPAAPPKPKYSWGSSAAAFSWSIFGNVHRAPPAPPAAASESRGIFRNVALGDNHWTKSGGLQEPPAPRYWKSNSWTAHE